jgi:16S rRNA (uracil1498-N3)-methyltransferase
MARRRFFVDDVRHGVAEIAGDDAHHLTRVLRVEKGQQYEISDNARVYLAEVTEAHRARVVFQIIEPVEAQELPVRVTLAAALFKFDRFEWMIEKATELGVDAIIPFESARTEKGLLAAARKRVERWRRIARESSQQSRRVKQPEIADPVRGIEAGAWQYRLVLDERGGAPLLEAIPAARRAGDTVCLLAGPEGGWTDGERERFATAWTPVSLGPQTLRAETAALAAVAVITNAWLLAGE